jgi:hypothetical protein
MDGDQPTSPFPMPGISPGNTLPGQAPVVGQSTSPFDFQSIIQQVASMPQYQQAMGQLGNVYGQESQLAQQQSDLAAHPPQTRWHPNYEPITGVGSALKDVGRGILQALSFTGPGQRVQNAIYGPGVQDWERKREMLASQLQTLRSQQEVPQEELRGLTGLAQGAGLSMWHGAQNAINQQNANTRATAVLNRGDFQRGLLSLDTAKLSEQERHNQVDELIRGQGVEVQRERNNVILSLGDQKISVDQAKFDAAVNNKQQGFFDQLFTSLGLKEYQGVGGSTAPVSTTAPAFSPSKTPAKAAPKAGGSVVKWGRDAQGNPVRVTQ